MIPLLNLQAASKHLNCSPSTLVQRGAQGELQVFALFENATGIAGLEDLPKFEEKLQELYDKGTGVFRPARAHFKGPLPPSRPSDCFRVPKGALEELATGAESVELPSAIIESHHKLTDPDPGTAWFVDFEHPRPSITLESLRFKEADLASEILEGQAPNARDPHSCFAEVRKPEGGKRGKAWAELKQLAAHSQGEQVQLPGFGWLFLKLDRDDPAAVRHKLTPFQHPKDGHIITKAAFVSAWKRAPKPQKGP
jgi:hypothetical protein